MVAISIHMLTWFLSWIWFCFVFCSCSRFDFVAIIWFLLFSFVYFCVSQVEKHYKRALDIYVRSLGHHDPNVSKTKFNLVRILNIF